MTREEAKELLGRTALLMFEHNGSSTLDGDKTLHIINQIFEEHEAQLKAKENHIVELNKMVQAKEEIIKSINIEAKEREDLFYVEIKAKEEEIERLKEDVELIKNIANGAIKGAIISHNIANEKARSIVAMLFWGWREYKRRGENWEDESQAYEQSFNKAYAMIKDNK